MYYSQDMYKGVPYYHFCLKMAYPKNHKMSKFITHLKL